MAKKMKLVAKSIIPVRHKRTKGNDSIIDDLNIDKGQEITVVDMTELRGTKYAELEDGNFVIVERDGIPNFE